MESTESRSITGPQLPPGFRFHPTDEELIVHYLRKKAASVPLPVPIIAEIDLYKFDPWELPAMASFGEREWYFFSQRDRKYPNGTRPNRAATSGYWKATGTDKPVMARGGRQKLGVKKALVFYGGKPPKGTKTNWIMHEYRLADKSNNRNSHAKPNSHNCFDPSNKKASFSLRLDDWVLCRIYHKNNSPRPLSSETDRDDSVNKGLALPENHGHMNLFEGLVGCGQYTGLQFPSSGLNTTAEAISTKRSFPFMYCGNGRADDSPAKRFQEGYTESTQEDESSNSTSITTLLKQQLGDAVVLGNPFPLPGVNWCA